MSHRGWRCGVRRLRGRQLVRLTTAAAVAVLPLAVDNVLEVSEHARNARGDIALHAVFVALEHEAYVATAQPTVARSVLPAGWGLST